MAIVAVVGEYLGASNGIGYLIAQAEGVFDTTGMFAGMAVLAFTVLLIGAVWARWSAGCFAGRPYRILSPWTVRPRSSTVEAMIE